MQVNPNLATRCKKVRFEQILTKCRCRKLIKTTFFSSSTQSYGGLTIYVKTISITLPNSLFSNAPKIFINQGMGNSSTHASIMRIYSIDSTTTNFKIVIQDLANHAAGYDIYYMAIDDTTMG